MCHRFVHVAMALRHKSVCVTYPRNVDFGVAEALQVFDVEVKTLRAQENCPMVITLEGLLEAIAKTIDF